MYVTAKDENEKRKQAGQARAAAATAAKNKAAVESFQNIYGNSPAKPIGTSLVQTHPSLGSDRIPALPTAPATPKTSTAPASATTPTASTAPVSTPAYDASLDNAYMQAISTLQAAQTAAPTYTGTYDGQLKALYDQIVSRDKFSYDINADAMYKQYAQQYQNSGKLAMQDTMGQASALTGGYDSTYGQSVGQQQYDAYLQQLNAVVPELYGQAYQRYQDEGDQMTQQYSLLRDMADDEYSKYKDSYARWADERDYQMKVLAANQEAKAKEKDVNDAAYDAVKEDVVALIEDGTKNRAVIRNVINESGLTTAQKAELINKYCRQGRE